MTYKEWEQLEEDRTTRLGYVLAMTRARSEVRGRVNAHRDRHRDRARSLGY
jgi:hypothetical protein